MAAPTMTDDERENLSDEEIEALESEDGDEGAGAEAGQEGDTAGGDDAGKADTATASDQAAGDDNAQEAGARNPNTDASGQAAADQAAADAAEAGGDADGQQAGVDAADASAADATQDDQPHVPYVHLMKRVDKDQLSTAEKALNDAQEKYDEGEIDFKELNSAQNAFNELKWKDDQAREYNESARQGAWQHSVDQFYGRFDQFSASGNRSLHLAFTTTVNQMIAAPEASKMTDWQLLMAAKRRVEDDLSAIMPPEAKAALDKQRRTADKAKALKDARKSGADRSKVADDDIGRLPQASDANDTTGEFAHIDKLDGEEYEAAVEALTPAQRARYEAAG